MYQLVMVQQKYTINGIILNSIFFDDNVLQRPSYGVYISQLIRFNRVPSHVSKFHSRNIHNRQEYLFQNLVKAFSKFYRNHYELIEKYHVILKKLVQQVFLIRNSMEIKCINLRK